MHLNYPKKRNGLFILSLTDFDVIAEEFLAEYAPDVLHEAQPLDIDAVISDCLYLDVRKAYLSDKGDILGMIVFSDTEIRYLNHKFEPQVECIPEGTIILDYRIDGRVSEARMRFTKAHEAAHWICHRNYFADNKDQIFNFRMAPESHIACRKQDVYETGKQSGKMLYTDEDWREWQANCLAAALLMPKSTFTYAAKSLFTRAQAYRGYLVKDRDTNIYGIVNELATMFKVSKEAATYRLKQLKLLAVGQSW